MSYITSVKSNGKKFYQTPVGLLPSVNEILDATAPPEETEKLEQWKQKTKKHEEIRQDSLARGTILHELAADFLSTQEEPDWVDTRFEPFWKSLLSYLETISRTASVNHALYGGFRRAIELPVYHPTLGYAGTLDWLGEHEPLELTLTDFKSSRWYKKAEYLQRHRLQLAAYRLAVETLFGLEVDYSDIVIAIPKYPPQIVHLTPEEMEVDNDLWLERLEQFRAQGGLVA
jgi:genome maintenance exonuclease 1